jgi:hypothetical protein
VETVGALSKVSQIRPAQGEVAEQCPDLLVILNFHRGEKAVKYNFAAIATIVSLACLTCVPRAEAGHGFRIDEGNGAGCMTTWTNDTSNTTGAAAFTPGGTYANAVACSASGGPDVLFPNGTPANDSATVNAAFTASSGEMYQYYSGAVGAQPDAQVVVWNLTTGPFGTQESEIELNGWCPGGSGSSFKFGGVTYTGGCSGVSTDLIFSQAGSLVGYVTDASDGTATIHSGTTVPGWTESGGSVSAPEIDSSTAITGLALLVGGLAVLRGSRRTLVRVR